MSPPELAADTQYPRIGLLIGGEWIHDRPSCYTVRNPSDETELGPVPGATADDVVAVADAGTVVVVGHQPDCSEIALALAGREIDFPTGGHTEIEL